MADIFVDIENCSKETNNVIEVLVRLVVMEVCEGQKKVVPEHNPQVFKIKLITFITFFFTPTHRVAIFVLKCQKVLYIFNIIVVVVAVALSASAIERRMCSVYESRSQ